MTAVKFGIRWETWSLFLSSCSVSSERQCIK